MPCYNYGRYLPHLVETLVEQPGVDVEVIVVDDHSPDGSVGIAERLAGRHPGVSVVRHEQNMGHIRTYNDGLAQVRSDYVALVSADDLLPPGALSRAVALMEAHPNVGLVYGYARSFTGEPPEPVASVRSWTTWPGDRWLSMSARRARCFISSPEVVMRTSALRAVGGYDPRLPHSADLDLWLRTALHFDIGRVNGSDQALYRVHDSNMHLTTFAGYVTDLIERRATFRIMFEEHARARDDVQSLQPRTWRALANEGVRRALSAMRDDRPELAGAFVDFALETDPTVRQSVWWHAWQLGPGRGRRLPLRGTRALGSRVVHHLAWRRERRFGF